MGAKARRKSAPCRSRHTHTRCVGGCRRGVWRHRRIAGTSLEPRLPSRRGNAVGGQGNDLGYGKNVWDWTIRSQAPTGVALRHTQGEGSETKWRWAAWLRVARGLRYSPALRKRSLRRNGVTPARSLRSGDGAANVVWAGEHIITGITEPNASSSN